MKKNKAIQGIRVIAFFMVFFYHCFFKKTNFFEYGGAIGVTIFFLLSGFCMTYNHYNEKIEISPTNCFFYAFNKIKKLYLLYFIVLCAAVFPYILEILHSDSANTIKTLIIDFIAEALLVQSFVPETLRIPPIVPSFWYMSALFFIYMLFPVIQMMLYKKNKKKLQANILFSFIIMMLLGVGVAYANFDIGKWFTYYNPFYRIFEFFIGCNLGCLYHLKFLNQEMPGEISEKSANKKILSVSDNKSILAIDKNASDKKDGLTIKSSALLYTICEIAIVLLMLITNIVVTNCNCEAFLKTMPNGISIIFGMEACIFIWIFAKEEGSLSKVLTMPAVQYLALLSGILYLVHGTVLRYSEIVVWHTIGEEYVYTVVKAALGLMLTLILAIMWRRLSSCLVKKEDAYDYKSVTDWNRKL